MDFNEDPYLVYTFYYGKMALYGETSAEVSYDENGVELPF
jgi:hypothetical protein